MNVDVLLLIVMCMIFILISLPYLYVFRNDKLLMDLYFSILPTFIIIFLILLYRCYRPVDGFDFLLILLFVSVGAWIGKWSTYLLREIK